MENQFVFDEVSKAFQKCVLTVKTNLHQMKKYLPDPQVAPFATILTNVSLKKLQKSNYDTYKLGDCRSSVREFGESRRYSI